MSTLSVLVVVALAAGCRDRSSSSRGAAKAVESDDAGAPLVDEGYRFQLTPPGPGWRLFRERDARQLNPDAVAALKAGEVTAVVIVDHVPGADLDAYADVVLGNLAFEDPDLTRDAATLGDLPAVAIRGTGAFHGLQMELRMRIAVRGEHAYQVLATAPVGMGRAADLDAAIAAFSLIPGEVVGRPIPTRVPDTAGPGWRVRGNVWESSTARLRLAPPPGWRLMVGDELARANPDAEVGLSAARGGAYLVVIADVAPGLRLDAYRAGALAWMREGRDELPEPASVVVAGRTVPLARLRDQSGLRLEYLWGVLHDADRVYQLLGWYPAALRAEAEPKLLAAMSGLEVLDGGVAEALAHELARDPALPTVIGPEFALRHGVYQDFGRGLTWRTPPGVWRVEVGASARARAPLALVAAEELASGLQVFVLAEPWTDADGDYHDAVRAALVATGVTVTGGGETRVGGAPARFVDATAEVDGLDLRYRATTTVTYGTGLEILVSGPASAWPPDDVVDAPVRALSLATPAMTVVGPPYEDRRMAFAVDLPASWTRRDVTPPPLRALGAIHVWDDGGRAIMVMAIYALDADEAWMADLMETLLRENFAGISTRPKSAPAALAGLPARHLQWTEGRGRIDAWLLTRGPMLYAVAAIDPRGGLTTGELARSSFRLLD